jgi:hypothetical protein
MILPILASEVARIKGVSHQCQAEAYVFNKIVTNFSKALS